MAAFPISFVPADANFTVNFLLFDTGVLRDPLVRRLAGENTPGRGVSLARPVALPVAVVMTRILLVVHCHNC